MTSVVCRTWCGRCDWPRTAATRKVNVAAAPRNRRRRAPRDLKLRSCTASMAPVSRMSDSKMAVGGFGLSVERANRENQSRGEARHLGGAFRVESTRTKGIARDAVPTQSSFLIILRHTRRMTAGMTTTYTRTSMLTNAIGQASTVIELARVQNHIDHIMRPRPDGTSQSHRFPQPLRRPPQRR